MLPDRNQSLGIKEQVNNGIQNHVDDGKRMSREPGQEAVKIPSGRRREKERNLAERQG